MAYLHDQMKRLRWDVRMKDYNLSRKLVSRDEWDKHLRELPDHKEQAKHLDFDERSFSREARRYSS